MPSRCRKKPRILQSSMLLSHIVAIAASPPDHGRITDLCIDIIGLRADAWPPHLQ